jgi:acyl-CoA synthetase (AMP-forming)/AMP-acid ligase II
VGFHLGSKLKLSSLVDLLCHRAQNQADQVGYAFLKNGELEAGCLTYRQLDLQARTIAACLQESDVVGERVLLLYQPGLEFVAAFFGCLYAGVVAVPAYPPRRNQNLSRLQAIISDASARLILTTTTLLDSFKGRFDEELQLAEANLLCTDSLSEQLATSWHQPDLNPNLLSFLQYTSGSTGNPKGVMVSHGNLLHNLGMIHDRFGHSTDSRGLVWLPPYHDMGLIGGVLQPLYGGFPVTLMSPVDFLQKPFRWLQAISRYGATTSGGPNFAYDLCIRKITPEQRETLDLSSWEVAFTGAEPIRAETLKQFAVAFEPCGFRMSAFYPCYGMAETTLMVSGGLKAAPPILCQVDVAALERNQVVVTNGQGVPANVREVVGCGQSYDDQKILIVNPDTRQVCSDGIGEIWVLGPSVAQGYWNRPEETKQAFSAYLVDGAGPFLRTGDLGFLQNGELFITGRLKDVIIIRGQNHYPQDIELVVEKSHPALRPNCGAAFSVDHKGSERLVVVHEAERGYLRKLDVKEVVNSIRQAVAAQHGLDIFATVIVKTGSIPKTSSGKIRRQACRSEFLRGSLDVVDDWSESPQGTSKFLNLQAEIDSMLQRLQTDRKL